MAEKEKQQGIQLQIDENVAQGAYANLTIVTHTENEFVLDYAFLQPPQGNAKVHSRIIINPKQAKRLAMILTNSVMQYEEKFGVIELASANSDKAVN